MITHPSKQGTHLLLSLCVSFIIFKLKYRYNVKSNIRVEIRKRKRFSKSVCFRALNVWWFSVSKYQHLVSKSKLECLIAYTTSWYLYFFLIKKLTCKYKTCSGSPNRIILLRYYIISVLPHLGCYIYSTLGEELNLRLHAQFQKS